MIRIVAAGDFNLGGDFALDVRDADKALEKLGTFRAHLPDSDVVFANLEGPVSDERPYNDSLLHITNPTWCPKVAAELGFNVLSLANNHIMDFGRRGLDDTLSGCRDWLAVTGAGHTLSHALEPAVIRAADGSRVCVLALADEWPDGWHILASESQPGYPSLYNSKSEATVARCVAEYDTVIVYIHWGLMRLYHPKPDHRRFAHRLLELGVPLVIGSHCHHIQGYERLGGGLIAYGLGDICFPRIVGSGFVLEFPSESRDSTVLHATIDRGRVVEFEFATWRFEDDGGLRLLTGESRQVVLDRQRDLSRGFSAADYEEWFRLNNSRSPATELSERPKATGR